MNAIGRIAEFVAKTALDDCPSEALGHVRRAALDSLGVMLAGAAEPAARIVRAVARAEGGIPLCTVVGSTLRTSPSWAALANGTAGHAHDFDDTSFALMGHPSVPLMAALLACGEAQMADGRAIALGYILGFEVSATVGAAINPVHYQRGWHATLSVGTLGCAAAAARVLSLDPVQTGHALAVAASLASGLKENFGSMTKPYHAGQAALNGARAAQLAGHGLTASDRALDGAQGYAAAFADPEASEALAEGLEGLGRRWHIISSRVAVKPYPSCALTHSAIDALLELRQAHGLLPEQVAAVEVGVNRVTPNVLAHAVPTTGLQRKFSMQYCAAAALAHGRVDFASFEDRDVIDPAVRDLMRRVSMVVDESLPDRLEEHAWSRVTVRLTDGRTLALPARGAAGHPDRPLSDQALAAKFMACATRVIPRDEAEGVAEQVGHLEDIPDIRLLTSRLVGSDD